MAKVFRNASLLLVATTTATALTSSELNPSGTKPDPRYSAKGCVDTSNSKLLIHGGYASGSRSRFDDLWAYDLVGNSWTELSPSGAKPSARMSHVAAMDTANSRLLIHGGNAGSGLVDDLWAYDLRVFPDTTPDEIFSALVLRGAHAPPRATLWTTIKPLRRGVPLGGQGIREGSRMGVRVPLLGGAPVLQAQGGRPPATVASPSASATLLHPHRTLWAPPVAAQIGETRNFLLHAASDPRIHTQCWTIAVHGALRGASPEFCLRGNLPAPGQLRSSLQGTCLACREVRRLSSTVFLVTDPRNIAVCPRTRPPR